MIRATAIATGGVLGLLTAIAAIATHAAWLYLLAILIGVATSSLANHPIRQTTGREQQLYLIGFYTGVVATSLSVFVAFTRFAIRSAGDSLYWWR